MNATATVTPRKKPKQSRSKATVDAIIEATARVLVERGFDGATTNHIAQVAGVSVGSLYQYFPNKAALVLAVVERHCTEMLEMLQASAQSLGDAPLPLAVRKYVKAMVDAHMVDPALHRVFVQQMMHVGFEHLHQIDRATRVVVQAYLDAHRDEIIPQDTQLATFVLVRAVEAVVHGVVLDPRDDIDPDALAEEVTALVLRYLLGDFA
jgi:AcrR family transcriptional regulator